MPLASGQLGWTLAHPEFGSSVNPIITRGADFAHHITDCPPGFENLAASLQFYLDIDKRGKGDTQENLVCNNDM